MYTEQEIAKLVGEWIRKARTDAKLSGDMLALKMTLLMGDDSKGNTKGNISHWENGRHNPSLRQLVAIVQITGKSLSKEVIDALTGGNLPQATQSPVNDDNESAPEAADKEEDGKPAGSPRLADAAGAKIIGLPKTPHTVSGDVLAAIGFLTDREGQAINNFRRLTERSKQNIEQGLIVLEKEPLSTVVDDKLENGASVAPAVGGNGK